MIHELRVYQCIPGKLPALLKRFESKTLDIWKKHGIRPTGFWTVLIGDGNNDLHYLLAWESLAEREQKWNAFQADAEWHKARDESEKDGLLIANIKTAFLRPTAFSENPLIRVPRGVDHIVHAVRDLDAAADLYRRLGFTVGARNRHPPAWGTQNHIVQLPGTFIELLAMADTSAIVEHAPRAFSFGACNRDFLRRGEGLSMLVLEGRGGPDAQEFRAAGIGDFDLFEFEREARRPDGAAVKVAFALAFAADPRTPDVGFFTCLHRHPENFWNPSFQVHANTAAGVAGVVLVAENPSDHHIFLSGFVGQRELLATSTGIALQTPRGEIAVMTPVAFRDHFSAMPPDTSRSLRLAALRITMRDMAFAERLLEGARLPFKRHMGRLVIGPEAAMGAALVFEGI